MGRGMVHTMVDVRTQPRDKQGKFAPTGHGRVASEVKDRLRDIASRTTSIPSGLGWPSTEPDRVPDDDLFGNPGDLTWKGAGFTPDESDDWIDGGIIDPDQAARLRDNHPGVTPDDMRLPSPYQGDPEHLFTIGEHLRDTTIPEVDTARVVTEARVQNRSGSEPF